MGRAQRWQMRGRVSLLRAQVDLQNPLWRLGAFWTIWSQDESFLWCERLVLISSWSPWAASWISCLLFCFPLVQWCHQPKEDNQITCYLPWIQYFWSHLFVTWLSSRITLVLPHSFPRHVAEGRWDFGRSKVCTTQLISASKVSAHIPFLMVQ